jgi:hypothetical protein
VQSGAGQSSQDKKIERPLQQFVSYLVHAHNVIVMLLQ